MAGHTVEQPGLVKRCIREGINKLRMFLRLPMPVDALPPEILSEVFGYLPPPNQKADLIRVTHVCKRWRAIATGNPTLWTSFQIHNFDGVQEFLRRSEILPLSLYHTKGHLDPWVPTTVAGVACRIRLLHVTLPVMQDVESLLAEPTVASPLLQVLHIEHLPQNMTADSERRPLMPLFNREAPALHSLVIRGIPLPLTPPRTLRHFDLGGCDVDALPHIHSLFDMLQACTLLDTLTIRGQHEPTFSMEHHTRLIVLPNLTFLRLALRPADVTAKVLMAFVLPPHVHVSLATELEGDLVFDDVLSRMCYPLPAPFDWSRSRVPVRRLHLAWNATHQLLRAYRDPGPEDQACSAAGIPAIEIDCRQPQIGRREGQWESFMSGWRFDTSHVETLVLECEPGEQRFINFVRWYPTLDRLPELRTLCVVRLDATDLHHIMWEIGGRPASFQMPKGTCPCPKLSTLELREVVYIEPHQLLFLKTALNVHFSEHADDHASESWKITLKMVRCGGPGLVMRGWENETPNVQICIEGSLRPWGCIVC